MFANMILIYSESDQNETKHSCGKALKALSVVIHHHISCNSLEDDAVADGGQQIVEVEFVFVVARIPATLLPKFHQSFSKPVT